MADTVKQAVYAMAGIYLCEDTVSGGVKTPADTAVRNEPPDAESEPVTPPG